MAKRRETIARLFKCLVHWCTRDLPLTKGIQTVAGLIDRLRGTADQLAAVPEAEARAETPRALLAELSEALAESTHSHAALTQLAQSCELKLN